MSWLQIETAPKDGSHMLLCVAGFAPGLGHFNAEHRKWIPRWEDDFRDSDDFDEFVAESNYFPTHWMPLPDPPKDAP